MPVRHDWYQTEQRVTIDVLVKNANTRNCSVDIQSNHVAIRGDDLELDFELAHEIDTSKSSFRILTVKIEITLQKLIGERWTSLTKDPTVASIKLSSLPKAADDQAKSSPSKPGNKNWDRVVKDACEKEEIDKVIE